VRPLRLRAEGEGAEAVEFRTDVRELGSGLRMDWSVRNGGRHPATLDRLHVDLEAHPTAVLEHGWQSWSVVRRCPPADVRPQRQRVPRWRRAMYLAEADRAGRVVAGDQFLLTDAGLAGFLDGRRHLSTVEAGPVGGLTATALLDGVTLPPGGERALDPLWLTSAEPGPAYSEFAHHWGVEGGARAAAPAPFGWCSWYHYYAAVTPADVRANLRAAAPRGVDVVQIDDGYQAAIGDWLACRPSWAEGTAALAADIRAAGVRPGIWTAPFLAAATSPVVRDHPDWVLRDLRGRPARAMRSPWWPEGWALALDPTHPGVLDHLAGLYTALAAQGFDYHKVDFCYAAALAGRRHDPSRTRAQALHGGLAAIRDALGDSAFLLGCGAPFGPSVGAVDAMRVSPDVAPRWGPARTLPGLEEAASCARSAILTSLLRAPLHRRLWVNDADCLLLRPTQTDLTPRQRQALADAVAGLGAFAVLSDDLATYGPEEWDLVARVRAAADPRQGGADAPLDIDDPFAADVTVRSPAYALVASKGADRVVRSSSQRR
jgi:alpha-galactosidase